MARLETLQEKLRELQQGAQPNSGSAPADQAAEKSDADDSDAPSIDSGADSDSDAVRACVLGVMFVKSSIQAIICPEAASLRASKGIVGLRSLAAMGEVLELLEPFLRSVRCPSLVRQKCVRCGASDSNPAKFENTVHRE